LHRDDDRRGNCLSNLYYGTPKENADDAVRNGKQRPGISLGEKHGSHKLTEIDVIAILAYHAQGKPYRRIANYFGVNEMTVRDVCVGKTWAWFTGQ
jgi:hypothetical protein